MKNLRWLSLLFLFVITACERTIQFSPNDAEAKLVVEATIETDKYPRVYLSRSMNYFSQISIDQLAGSFVRNADIQVSNGSATVHLKEYEAPLIDDYFVYYYTVDSSEAGIFKGEEGKTYTLSIKTEGGEYSSTTTIPHLAKIIDSLYYEENIDDEDSSKVVLYGKFNDPPGFGNYSRYFTAVNGGTYYPGLNSVFDDQVIDGESYKVQIEQGVDRNNTIDFEDYSYFHKGDSISIKFCNIDKGVFDFWRTMEYSYSSIGNPFSSPTKVSGNISNGALGYFGGYAVQYVGIVIPE
jgi:hypothetical protein